MIYKIDMKKISILYLMAFLLVAQSCNRLELTPKGILSEDQISTPKDAEGFVISAYSHLGNDHRSDYPFSLWPYGNVRSDDAYKGGRDANDVQNFHFLENFTAVRPDLNNFSQLWFRAYSGLRRTNEGLRILGKFTAAEYPQKEIRTGELRFLRGYWYFMLKILFKNIPYIDETLVNEEYALVSNRALSNDELWNKIAEDFSFAAQVLPAEQPEVGRANKIAAYAYLAKTRLYQAYEQDEKHSVVNINKQRLQEVIDAADKVIGTRYGLENDFANAFLPGTYENGKESIFAVQFSANDGVGRGRLNYSDYLSVPQGMGCCDFQKPSQNLVNAFHTSNQGMPLFDTYNAVNVNFSADFVDPRLDHTVSRPGNPWKYETTIVVTQGWSRAPAIYGYFNSLKENVAPTCDCFVNVDPYRGNTKPRIILRYADILLFKAEALIELDRPDEALPLINQVRERAANSTARLKNAAGNPLSIYRVETYKPGVNITWNKTTAREALRFERRLEFALEGSRFFDLVRWGIADQVMNSYLDVEKTRRSIYKDGKFTKGRDEYLPVPQSQMNFAQGAYIQNPGY